MNYTKFLEGTEKDDKGRTIEDILKLSNFNLESTHDYIQRVFPTDEQSMYSDAPPLTVKDLEAFTQSITAQENMRKMYQRMLVFWKLDGENYKEWGNIFPVRLWNLIGNHNHKRITRVLKSLKLFGMDKEYKDFSMRISYMLNLQKDGNKFIRISDETAEYWEKNIL